MQRELKEGFTTGTAASAAAYAAVRFLLEDSLCTNVMPELPPFVISGTGYTSENPQKVPVPVLDGGREGDIAWACVIKDAGDDPDATHKALIVVHASKRPFSAPVRLRHAVSGAMLEDVQRNACPSHSITMRIGGRTIHISGGTGVGTVTLPGLPIAPGEPAINPEPRKQIAVAADAAASACGYEGDLHLLVSVPDGEAIARHTMNARLGIKGGISILGTRGTVRPYSHDAWRATIMQGLHVASALGLDTVLFSTGRRSERLGFAHLPDLPEQAGIQVADFAGYALQAAALLPFQRVVWCCFPGKLLKLAQGLAWTHAKGGDSDITLLARLWQEKGGDVSVVVEIAAMPTAAGAFAIMDKADSICAAAVLAELGQRAYATMTGWMEESRAEVEDASGLPPQRLCLLVFSQKEDGGYELRLRL